jgi:EAL domain-containing protein (putative c-di-GMP-specific phosphodiesterase class I)
MLVPDLVTGFMKDMQARGISFALDDFGAGYTSFRFLKEFYFDIIKIEGQFVRGIATDPDNQVLTAALASIGQQFDMVTVAESVEKPEDAAYLAALGIDCLQGYYFGAPTVRPPWLDTALDRAIA